MILPMVELTADTSYAVGTVQRHDVPGALVYAILAPALSHLRHEVHIICGKRCRWTTFTREPRPGLVALMLHTVTTFRAQEYMAL